MRIKIAIFALVVALTVSVSAVANGGPVMVRQILSGGASAASASGVTIRATLGEPLVGTVTGGDAAVAQGFWHGGVVAYRVYLPLVLK